MFEFSRKQTILSKMGLYARLVLFGAFVAIAMIYTDPIALAVMLMVCIFLCLLAGMSLKQMLSTTKPLLTVFGFLFLFSSFTYSVNNVNHEYARHVYFTLYDSKFMTVALSSGGMLFGVSFVFKMMVMMFASALLVYTSPMEEILLFLEKIGFPYQIGLMMSIALRFIPTLSKEVAQIQEAQKARGAGFKRKGGTKQAVKGTIPLFVPMIVSSIRRSDTMAMSMISRGYGFSKHRTQLATISMNVLDIFYILILIGITSFLLFAKTKLGLGVL
jgi:energy-coupling factor transport system permease protein